MATITPTQALHHLDTLLCSHCDRRHRGGLTVHPCTDCARLRREFADLCLDAILEAKGTTPEEVL